MYSPLLVYSMCVWMSKRERETDRQRESVCVCVCSELHYCLQKLDFLLYMKGTELLFYCVEKCVKTV